MALFNFGSISFDSIQRSNGEQAALLNPSYSYQIRRFPLDIGNYDKGHYMIFHINAQRNSQYEFSGVSDGEGGEILPDVIQNSKRTTVEGSYNNIANGTAILKPVLSNQGVDTSSMNLDGGLRTIRRTTETIALYMPDTLNFQSQQSYNDLQLGKSLAAAVLSSGLSFFDTATGKMKSFDEIGARSGAVKNLSPFIKRGLDTFDNALGGYGSAAWTAATGTVENPMLELIYSSPSFREFQFSFMFYPRSEKEGREVQEILKLLKFHQCPEVAKMGGGYFLIPPSEFDIKFYYNGAENVNIPKISTCVLTNIDVDYAPNGFAAYETLDGNISKLGGTGMPVAIRLNLNFKETEIITKKYYRDSTYATSV